jgi:hypothetical protein
LMLYWGGPIALLFSNNSFHKMWWWTTTFFKFGLLKLLKSCNT